jgi:hypothetical protein
MPCKKGIKGLRRKHLQKEPEGSKWKKVLSLLAGLGLCLSSVSDILKFIQWLIETLG